jgi:hypothetical protein
MADAPALWFYLFAGLEGFSTLLIFWRNSMAGASPTSTQCA